MGVLLRGSDKHGARRRCCLLKGAMVYFGAILGLIRVLEMKMETAVVL